MKITIRNRNLSADQTFDALIENRILALATRCRLDDVAVLIERRSEASPQYRVDLHVAVPGPDLRCECVDHSPLRAFQRALEQVEEKLEARSAKRVGNTRTRSLRTAGARIRGPQFR